MAVALVRVTPLTVSGFALAPANSRSGWLPHKPMSRIFFSEGLKAGVMKPRKQEKKLARTRAVAGNADPSLLATRFLFTIGLPPEEVARVSKVAPGILSSDVDLQLARAIDVLFDAGVDPDDLPLIVSRCPHVLVMDIESELEPMSRYLQLQLHLQKEQMRKIITRFPEVFTLSIDQQVAPAIKFMKEFGGARDEDIPSIVYTCPQALSFSIPRLGSSMHWLVPKRT